MSEITFVDRNNILPTYKFCSLKTKKCIENILEIDDLVWEPLQYSLKSFKKLVYKMQREPNSSQRVATLNMLKYNIVFIYFRCF